MIGNLFTCFPVPPEVSEAVLRTANSVTLPPGWRVVDPSEWHLTLVFVGPHDPEPFRNLLEGISTTVSPLSFTGWSFFPDPGMARVLALSGPTPPALLKLVTELSERAEATGWKSQHAKPFVLHLTVARGPVTPAFEVPAIEPIVLVPKTLELWRTEGLHPARYTTLASQPCDSTSSASRSTT